MIAIAALLSQAVMEPFDPRSAGDKPEPDARQSPIDTHVGARMKLRRTLMGLSQEKLGEKLGLTFQQVQKYERGVNRVSASRLYDLARVLDVPIGFFFDDLPAAITTALGAPPTGGYGNMGGTARHGFGFADTQDAFGADDVAARRETAELVRAYHRISDPAVRKRIHELVRSLGPDEGKGP